MQENQNRQDRNLDQNRNERGQNIGRSGQQDQNVSTNLGNQSGGMNRSTELDQEQERGYNERTRKETLTP